MRTPCDGPLVELAGLTHPCAVAARRWVLAATILASSMAFIDGTVVNVALPSIQTSFHATVVGVQWVVASYGLLLSALILAGGSLGDMFGRRLVFVIGVAVFGVASVACGLASNITQLIVARSVQGVGAAMLVPGSLAIISTSFDEETRGRAIGTWSGFTAITTAVGPVLGGWLVQHASWRWAFLINLPLAVAVIAMSFWKIPESRSSVHGRVDWLGTSLATLGLAGVVTGFIESVNLGWGSPVVYGSLVIGFGALVLFLFVESRTTSPVIPLSMFQSRNFSGANLLTLFVYSAIGIFFFLFPLNLIQVQGYSATASGAAVLPFILLMFVLSRWSGGLVARYGAKRPLIVGPLITATGFLLFALPSVGGSYWKSFFPAVMVLGLGMAILVAPLTTLVMSSVQQDRVGTASGINNAVSRFAGVLAIAVLGIVLVNSFSSRLEHSLASLSLPGKISEQIRADTTKLGGLQIPDALDPGTRAAVQSLVKHAFVFGFRIIMFICAALGVAGAGVAWLMISHGEERGRNSVQAGQSLD